MISTLFITPVLTNEKIVVLVFVGVFFLHKVCHQLMVFSLADIIYIYISTKSYVSVFTLDLDLIHSCSLKINKKWECLGAFILNPDQHSALLLSHTEDATNQTVID